MTTHHSLPKKIGIGCGCAVLVLALSLLAAVYVWGPSYGAMFTGKPIFMGHATPQRYAKAIVTTTETMGIYADSPEFADAKSRVLEQAKDARSTEELYPILDELVAAAGGKHSKLHRPAEETSDPSDGDDAASVPDVGVEKRGPIAVATVPGIGRHDDLQGYADTLAHGLHDAVSAGACGAVVDLRGNDGGDMGPMVAGLSPLLPDGTALEFVSRINTTKVAVDGNSVTGGGTSVTTSGGKVDVPVAVLVDGQTASSGEATMLTFRGLENARSFGSPTAGYASANMVFDYPDGSSLMLTIGKDKDRTGQEYAEDPISPDEETSAPEDAAQAWLQRQGCTR